VDVHRVNTISQWLYWEIPKCNAKNPKSGNYSGKNCVGFLDGATNLRKTLWVLYVACHPNEEIRYPIGKKSTLLFGRRLKYFGIIFWNAFCIEKRKPMDLVIFHNLNSAVSRTERRRFLCVNSFSQLNPF